MSKQRPQRLIIKYDDGSTKEVEFSQVSRAVQLELSKLGLCPRPSPLDFVPRRYLLLKWKDGWQEVTGIEEDSTQLLRYYVIQRAEEAGRLVIERSGAYPELIVIGRRPRELERVVIIGDKDIRTYALAEKAIATEGDKTEYHYEFDENDRNSLEQVIGLLRKALRKEGIKAKELLARRDAQRVEDYERIRKQIGLKASEKEEDVLGFIQVMLQILAKGGEISE